MARGIPVPFEAVPKTQTNTGNFQKAEGLPGLRTDAGASVRSAGMAPNINARGFIVSAAAVGEIGQAVSGEAKEVSESLIRQNESVNKYRVAEASQAIRAEEAAIAEAMRQEPDETKWEEIAQKRTDALQKQLLADPKRPLSVVAREAIGQQLSMWRDDQLSVARVTSERRSHDKAAEAMHAEAIYAADAGDLPKAQEFIERLRSEGRIPDNEAARLSVSMKERVEANAKRAEAERFNAAENLAVEAAGSMSEADALKLLELGEYGEFPAADKEKLRNTVLRVNQRRTVETLDSLAEGMVTGDVKSEAAIDAAQSPFLTPVLRDHAKKLLRESDREKEALDREVNGIRNAVEMRQKVKDYDPAKDPDKREYLTLKQEISARVNEGRFGEISGELYQKYGIKAPRDLKVRPEIQRNVTAQLDRIFDPVAGAIPWRRAGKNAAGNDAMVDDLDAKRKAIDAQTEVEMKMNDWFKENPDKAESLPEVNKALNNFKKDGTRLGALMSMMSLQAANAEPPTLMPAASLNGAKVTSYAYQNDETPDSNSSAGIGAWVPDAEAAKIKRGEPSDYRLRDGDFAVSPDVEKQMRAAGIRPRDTVSVKFADGSTGTGRWMDRTADSLTGRVDFYRGGKKTKHDKEGMKVLGFERADPDA